MPRDFKIGMGLGLLIVAVALIWFVSRGNSNMNSAISSYKNEQPDDQRVLSPPQLPARNNKNDESSLDFFNSEAAEKGLKEALEMEWPKIHVVQEGQSLSQISNQYYGTPAKWKKILEANRLRLKNKDQIRPDMRLLIPE